MGWPATLANSLGVAEEGLRLILGQISGYPLFLFHRFFLRKAPPPIQHAFFAISGMLISYWSIGLDSIIHSSTCILVTWATVKVFQGSFASTVAMYIFHMAYLGIGYAYTESAGYDINWTMPGCVLCLRMIGLAADVHDGSKNEETLSKDQKENALKEPPTILEIFSQAFFVGGYFVGPQFSMKKFQNYIQRNINEDIPPLEGSKMVRFGFRRLGIGLCYLAGHLLGDKFLTPVGLIESPEFAAMSFFKRSLYFSIWVKVILAKYISAWLLSEGALILSGMGYNGNWEDGSIKWNGGANVRLRIFEKSSRFQHIIDGFNINTNAWVMSYVYKRLRFLNNKILSQLGALVFLAVWHGWHPGYYITFFNEFLVMQFEKNFFPIVDNNPTIQRLNENPIMRGAFWILGKTYVFFFMPHCFLPFALLTPVSRIWSAIKLTGGLGYVFFGSSFLWIPLIKTALRKPRTDAEPSAKKEN